ncbi:DDE superfamily endonuclease, partial [Rathayibacter iranicus NCPPB 2253 = VKM Ac-1602]
MSYKSTTGLDSEQITELVSRIWQITQSRATSTGRAAILNLREQVIITLVLVRQNLNQMAVGDLFCVSQPTVSRIYRRIVPLIEEACCLSGVALTDAAIGRVLLVDGTDVPTGNRASAWGNYSGKRHRQGLNVQIACDLDGGLLCVSDPVAGARHDRAAITLCGWEPILDNTEWRADPGYHGTTATTPAKKPIGRELDDNTKANNRTISRRTRAMSATAGSWPCSSAWVVVTPCTAVACLGMGMPGRISQDFFFRTWPSRCMRPTNAVTMRSS